jgi:hypothetical protein
MKRTYIVMIAAAFAASSVYPINITSPYFGFRSQGINLAREFAGWQQHTYKHNVKHWHGSFFLAPSYTQSTNGDAIASILFGPDLQHPQNCCEEFIVVSGSQVPRRKKHDWLADYFGLPTDFQSNIEISPRIRNFILDMDLFLAFNWKCHNLFVQIHAPYVYSKWRLNFDETVINSGTNDYTALYMTPASVNRGNLLNSASAFFAGCTPDLGQSVIFDPLCCSKISNDSSLQHGSHIADLQLNIGTFALADDDYHVGIALRAVIPTGTEINGEYIFQPIVGNGHHWELGAYGNIYVMLWQNEAETRKLTGHALAYVTYMFKTSQIRCFDLFDKPNSRYMLAQRLANSPREQPQLTGKSDANTEFQNEFAPVANITSAKVFAGSNFQADAVFAITYTTGNLSIDLGYDYWFRGCEQVRIKDRCMPEGLNGNSWALKGDAYVFGFASGDLYYPDIVRLAATEQRATIRSGTNNYPTGVNGISSFQNGGVDNRIQAEWDNPDPNLTTVTAINGQQMYTSEKPLLFLTIDSIDLTGTQGYSDKLFAHVNYTWQYNKTYSFFLGFGGEYEIGKCTSISEDHKDCFTSCLIDDCLESSLSQFGVWIKGGFSFK